MKIPINYGRSGLSKRELEVAKLKGEIKSAKRAGTPRGRLEQKVHRIARKTKPKIKQARKYYKKAGKYYEKAGKHYDKAGVGFGGLSDDSFGFGEPRRKSKRKSGFDFDTSLFG